ncbi:hypothetical protein [Oceanobacillus sp. J11TS1]|uniref:hypothetical protein n=1 Tax=Oceanobacillus sp. J11TS1 TaxID=2807191 RepID=UPI001B25B1F7|nr:hypothetical protein [Oceanobacillus sp. J11TS1]GIO22773.1 hypothetical protein J11TS1_13540 [Oceanobacillus sp. J11TS1]
MEFEDKLEEIFNDTEASIQVKINRIADIGDYLQYGDIDKETTVKYLDILIRYLVQQDDDDMKEEILGIILDTEDSKVVDEELNLTPIVSNLSIFNEQCISYILSILGYSGKEQYRILIESFKDNPKLKDDVEDASYELNYRIKNN